MLKFLDMLTSRLSNFFLAAGGLSLVAMMILACSNMTLRAVWIPVKGTFELMGFFGAVTAAFALGYTQLNKGHIAVTVLAGVFPRSLERIIDASSSLLCAFFFTLACRETIRYSDFLRETGEVSETLHIIYHPFTYAVAAGLGLLALALLCDFLRRVLPEKPTSRTKEDAK